MQWYKYILVAVIILGFPPLIHAQLVMNEIYPAPANNELEWVELYNSTELPVATDQFILKDLTGKEMTMNSISVAPHSYALATSSALLNNKDESIFLVKKTGETIQTVTYSNQFDATTSYGVCPDGTSAWQVSQPTKLAANSCPSPTPTPSPMSTPTPTLQPVPTIISSETTISNIFINEVLAAPNTGEKEWLELYNNNDAQVTLTNWFIDSHQFTVSIEAHSYAAIEMTSSLFNNSGDTIHLYNSEQTLKDTLTYTSTEKNISWGRTSPTNSSLCRQVPTRGSLNSVCLSEANTGSNNNPALTTKSSTSSSTKASTTKSTSASSQSKPKSPQLYQGIVPQQSSSKSPPVEEKEYRIAGYKNEAQPLLQSVKTYGLYVAGGFSLLAIGMILVKMRRYRYEKDQLMALAVVAACAIHGHYLLSLFAT